MGIPATSPDQETTYVRLNVEAHSNDYSEKCNIADKIVLYLIDSSEFDDFSVKQFSDEYSENFIRVMDKAFQRYEKFTSNPWNKRIKFSVTVDRFDYKAIGVTIRVIVNINDLKKGVNVQIVSAHYLCEGAPQIAHIC